MTENEENFTLPEQTAGTERKTKKKADKGEIPNADVKYTVKELSAAEKTFSAHKDIIKAALLMQGGTEYTVSEAKDIVNNFKKRRINIR